jgi:hypothetical protein
MGWRGQENRDDDAERQWRTLPLGTNPLACPRSGLPSTADLRRREKHFPRPPSMLLRAPTPPALDLGA